MNGLGSAGPEAEFNVWIPIKLGGLLAELLGAHGPALLVATCRRHFGGGDEGMQGRGFGVGMVANVEPMMFNVQLGSDQGDEPGEELRAIISGGDEGCLDDEDKARETSLGIPEEEARGRLLAGLP